MTKFTKPDDRLLASPVNDTTRVTPLLSLRGIRDAIVRTAALNGNRARNAIPDAKDSFCLLAFSSSPTYVYRPEFLCARETLLVRVTFVQMTKKVSYLCTLL